MMDPIKYMREEFDSIDSRIVELLNKRFELSEKIGMYKLCIDVAFEDAVREAQIMQAVRQQASEAQRDHIEAVFRTVLEESKQIQLKLCK